MKVRNCNGWIEARGLSTTLILFSFCSHHFPFEILFHLKNMQTANGEHEASRLAWCGRFSESMRRTHQTISNFISQFEYRFSYLMSIHPLGRCEIPLDVKRSSFWVSIACGRILKYVVSSASLRGSVMPLIWLLVALNFSYQYIKLCPKAPLSSDLPK